MKTQNFTQFCIENNLPCDYDTMFQAQLLGSRGLAGKVSNRTIKSQDDSFIEMQKQNKKAHELFYNGVKNGSIIDASGKLVKDEILKKEAKILTSETEGKIKNLQSYIDFVKGMKTAYLKNGKLKKGYQLAVNDHEEKILKLKSL
jgi:uncharacterized protein RhaS with RHS repeats